MNKFSFYQATSVADAIEKTNSTVSETIQPESTPDASVLKAGGIDLLDLMKEGICKPSKLVSVLEIPGLTEITYDEKSGLKLGANVTLAEIASNPLVVNNYTALKQSAEAAATPQIRNMATLGGNLMQRTRCWYFRSKDHVCFRKGGGICFAQDGENQYHAILLNQTCASLHSSSLATALVALDASVEIRDAEGKTRFVPLDNFFVLPTVDEKKETILSEKELILSVQVPPMNKNAKSVYLKQGERESHDWPLAETAVVIQYSGGKCKKAKVVLGAAAPVPYVSEQAIKALEGNEINEEIALLAGKEAMLTATPLSQNAYKVPIFETLIKRAVLITSEA